MRVIPLIFSFMLAGCATGNVNWPSLAYRPGETAVPRCGAGAVPGAAVSEAPNPIAAHAAPDLSALTGQAVELCHKLDSLAPRWEAQAAATERAVTAARGDAAGGTVWSAAQLALSSLDEIGTQIDEQARLAADLLRRAEERVGAAATAPDTTAALGTLRDTSVRADRMAQRHRTLYDQLRGRLAS